MNLDVTARFATGIFFPQRLALKIDGRAFSPLVLERVISAVARDPAFKLASESLQDDEIQISVRHLSNLSLVIGGELATARDTKTAAYFDQPLKRRTTEPEIPIPLACVSVDGGRVQTRRSDAPSGVFDPHWRETKNAVFLRMTGVRFDQDPCPDLPDCYRNRNYMKRLFSGLEAKDAAQETPSESVEKSNLKAWRPERLFRTCLSSLYDSRAFGRMMEAEADSRGFYSAAKQAFVCDGLPYNWTIHKKHFPKFTAILDLPHALEHVYEVARALHEESDAAWDQYVQWATDIWTGHASGMVEQLRAEQSRIGLPPQGCEETDPRKTLANAVTYFTNNLGRMDYPKYRQEGLPTSSALMESYVKEVGKRVKGTEKFWCDGPSAEAILQLRAARLGDDRRLKRHMRSRPGNPYRPNVKKTPPAVAT